MGPVFIKFGQMIASRSDLFGSDISKELSVLRDRIPGFDFCYVVDIFKRDFGVAIEDLFTYFSEKPVAAASVAQVHRAITLEGVDVAVKVLRPKIHKRFSSDLKLIYFLCFLLQIFVHKRLKLCEIVDTFRCDTKFELDLRFEASNCAELKENCKDEEFIHIPSVYWDYTSCNVFTMDWIDGVPIYSESDNDLLAKTLPVLFFKQVYEHGFFHGDLHPGNLLITKANKLALIDFGVMGRIDKKTRVYMAEILISFLNRDYQRVADIHYIAGYVDPKHINFVSACRAIGESVVGKSSKDIHIGRLLTHLFKVASDFEMEVQLELLLLQKNTVLIESNCRSLFKDINVWEAVRPYMNNWSLRNLNIRNRICNKFKLATVKSIPSILEFCARFKTPRKPTIKPKLFFLCLVMLFAALYIMF